MNMRFALGVLVIIVCSATFIGCMDSGRKAEWAFLQTTESQFQEKPISEMVFHSEGKYHAVGIRSEYSGTNIWILLNPKASPFYKQIPQGQFSITDLEFQAIVASGKASETVLECLQSHIIKQPK